MASKIFEIELNGQPYEIEANDIKDAVAKGKRISSKLEQPTPQVQQDTWGSRFAQTQEPYTNPQRIIELQDEGKPFRSLLHGVAQVAQGMGAAPFSALSATFPKQAQSVGRTISGAFSTPIPVYDESGNASGTYTLGDVAGEVGKGYQKIPEPIRDVASIGGAVYGGATLAKPMGNIIVGASKVPQKITSGINKIAGKYASEASGVSEEALRMAGTKQGREALQKAYGTQAEVGQNLVDAIDNAWDVIPKSKEIKSALKNVPNVKAEPIINKLASSIPEAKTAEMKAVAEKLNQKADEIFSLIDANGTIPADKLFEFRQEIDNIIGDSWGKESGKFVSALKDVRKSIKDELLTTAKGTEYESTMKDMATKLDALDKIKSMLGKTEATRELRAESFIRNINGLGKEQRREWLKNFENVFGGDFAARSKAAQLAEQMGNEGKGSILPKWTTGRSMLSQGVGLVTGSPVIASRVTLPITQGAENLASKLVLNPSRKLRLKGRP